MAIEFTKSSGYNEKAHNTFILNITFGLKLQTMSASHTNGTKKRPRFTAPILVNSAEVEVLRALRRQGRISRTEISNITGWSKAKASQEIRSLVDKGYLMEIGEGISQGGRKPQLLRINNQLGYIAGIDIGATSLD